MRANIDDKGIFGDVFGGDVVVASKEENDLGWGCSWSEIEAQLKGIHLSLASMEDVESVPAVFRVYEFVVGGNCPGVIEDGVAIGSGEDVMADDQKWKFCGF